MNTFDLWIERYRQHCQLLNHSATTLRSRRSYLGLFAKFCEEAKVKAPAALTAKRLQDFQKWVFYRPTKHGQTRCIQAHNQVLSAVRSFLRFLAREGQVPAPLADALAYAKEPRTLPRDVLTPEEACRVLEAPDTKMANGYRDRTILEVLYSTGIRSSELRHIRVEDVNLEDGLLRINEGKGRRDRLVPLSSLACRFVENYLHGIRPHLLKAKACPYLFVSWRGRPLSSTTLESLVSRYARKAEIRKHVTPHVWRHTCATHLLRNNANLRHVQEILGHRSLATTERYLRLTITDLKEAHRRCHPREKIRHPGDY